MFFQVWALGREIGKKKNQLVKHINSMNMGEKNKQTIIPPKGKAKIVCKTLSLALCR